MIGNEIDPNVISGSTPSGDIGLYNYQWQISTDNILFNNISSAIAQDYDPLPISTTRYYKRIVTGSNCALPLSLVSNVIKIEVNVVPKADFELPDFCLNDGTAIFNNMSTIEDGTSNNLTYLWNFGDPGSGVLNTSTQKIGAHIYSGAQNYIVTLKATSVNGCTSDPKSYPFTVNGSTPRANFIIRNALKLCSNTTIQFEDHASVDFGEITQIKWYFDLQNHPNVAEVDMDPGLRATPKVYEHVYNPFNIPFSKQFNVGMVVYSGATCVDSTTKTITVNAAPGVEFKAIPPVCVDKPAFQLTQGIEKFGIVGQGLYSGIGVSATGMFTPSIAGVGSHTITYTYKSNADCIDSDTQDVIVNPAPIAESKDLELLEGGEVTFPTITNETGLDYSWSPAAFLSQSNILNPIASPVETTTYILTATDKITGCSAIGSINVLVHKKPEVPNVFTPNGDNVNDYWVINNLNTYTNCTVNVFNRYGKKIYSSVGYSVPWDGRYKDSEVASGTYYYIIDPEKGRKQITGSITVLR